MRIPQYCCVLLISTLAHGLAGAAPKPAAADGGRNAFTGTVDVAVYAIDTALYAKAPGALVAAPAKWLEFLARTSKESKACEVLRAEMRIQNGVGVLEKNTKDNIYAVGFLWAGDSVAPNPEQRSMRRSGQYIGIKSATVETDILRFEHSFSWVPEFGIRRIEGVTKDYAYPAVQVLRCRSWAAIAKGTTLLAGEWRSEIPPPGCEAGSKWQYFLFYSLR